MKKIHVLIFGIGNVGNTLIEQVLAQQEKLKANRGLTIEIPVILNSTTAFFKDEGIGEHWQNDFKNFGVSYQIEEILEYLQKKKWENVIAIDATASDQFVENYIPLIRQGAHLVAANKTGNTRSWNFYQELRKVLRDNNKLFYYETNVGAGLPVVEPLQRLHATGDNIQKVRGVFSGSLSYIFNTFSAEKKSFTQVLEEAQEKGYTEPNPAIDLSGIDVARKLLILARELGLAHNMETVKVKNLLKLTETKTALAGQEEEEDANIDEEFQALKNQLGPDEVLRYIGELDVKKNSLEVKLVTEKKSNPLGSLQGADSLFEIYTESYGEQPIVIQGAGAGAAVTARGVFTDILKLSERLN